MIFFSISSNLFFRQFNHSFSVSSPLLKTFDPMDNFGATLGQPYCYMTSYLVHQLAHKMSLLFD